MSKLSSKSITFAKPYLEKVAEIINNETKLKFEGNVSQVVNKTPDVKKFLRAVKQGNEQIILTTLKSGTQFMPIFNGYRWTQIDKTQFTGRTAAASGATTAMQENASLYAIRVGIEKNGYSDRKKFLKEHRTELKKIYPDMSELWEETFFQQQLTVQREVGNTKYNHYSRDDGFMEYITNIARDMYGITKKDTWNPADIWLVSNYEQVKRKLDKAIKDDTTSIQEFNAILRDMFHDRKIVGISLKLMSGKTAKWELVNLEKEDLFDNDEYRFKHDTSELNLSLKQNKKEFVNTDSKIKVDSKNQTIKFQIRQNSAGFNNLKIEGTDIGASSARLGKVPLDMATQLFKGTGLEGSRWRNWRNYPTNAKEYEVERSTFEKKFAALKRTNEVDFGGVKTKAEFSDNITVVFRKGKADIANSKLIQLDLLHEIFSLRGDKLDNFLTNLAFLAQKKGTVFGPFAKLY